MVRFCMGGVRTHFHCARPVPRSQTGIAGSTVARCGWIHSQTWTSHEPRLQIEARTTKEPRQVTRFTLRSLFLLITLAAVGLWWGTREARRQGALLREAQAALERDGIAWSPAVNKQGMLSIHIDGSKLSMNSAMAIIMPPLELNL